MAFQTVFKRYELKYMLTQAQKETILEAVSEHMRPDSYGPTTVRNLYLDTENYCLIRRSIEKPEYKEKLRLRSYTTATPESTVFAELKKKCQGVVYKRRLPLGYDDATAWLCGRKPCPVDTQISREIDYFLGFYGSLRPTVFLSYRREAYHDAEGGDFRVTFDSDILCRQDDLSLCSEVYGQSVLPQDRVLMELKCSGGIPLWMVRVLSQERIYKTPFSKYGRAYAERILPSIQKNKETDKNGIVI